MSLPEISRRCLSCGAAVRAGSRFCQQCGKTLEAAVPEPEERETEAASASVPPTGEWAQPSLEETPRAEELTPPTKEFAAFRQTPDTAETQAATVEPVPAAAPTAAAVEVEPSAPVVSATESRAEAASEEVGRAGDLRGRVARVREEAIVVLEETPDDSGLRFVLVAAALFVISLVLLFLSTTILR